MLWGLELLACAGTLSAGTKKTLSLFHKDEQTICTLCARGVHVLPGAGAMPAYTPLTRICSGFALALLQHAILASNAERGGVRIQVRVRRGFPVLVVCPCACSLRVCIQPRGATQECRGPR